jgi:hypothetical protein
MPCSARDAFIPPPFVCLQAGKFPVPRVTLSFLLLLSACRPAKDGLLPCYTPSNRRFIANLLGMKLNQNTTLSRGHLVRSVASLKRKP